MTKLIASTLFAALAGTLAVLAMPAALVAQTEAVQPSFDVAVPATAATPEAIVITAVKPDAARAE